MYLVYAGVGANVGFLVGTVATGFEVVVDDVVDDKVGGVGMVKRSDPKAAPPPELAVARPVDAENVRPPTTPGAFGPEKYGSVMALLLNPK